MEDRRFGNGRHSISKTARRNGEAPARSPKPADLGATVASERTVPTMVIAARQFLRPFVETDGSVVFNISALLFAADKE